MPMSIATKVAVMTASSNALRRANEVDHDWLACKWIYITILVLIMIFMACAMISVLYEDRLKRIKSKKK